MKADAEDQFTLLPRVCMKMTSKLIKDLDVYQLKTIEVGEKKSVCSYMVAHAFNTRLRQADLYESRPT